MINHAPRPPFLTGRVWLLLSAVLIAALILPVGLPAGLAAPQSQTNITTDSVIQRLTTYFGTFANLQAVQRGWITIGDTGKAKARLDQWDVEAYIDAAYLDETKANAAYVDYTNAGLGYFNDLVYADQPANVAGVTVWHEVMHAIFDANDDELLVSNDEIYTWFMEGQVRGLDYLGDFEAELTSPDCDPQELEKRWNRYSYFITNVAPDFGGYGAMPAGGRNQLAGLTGFQVPEPAALRGLYESSGLIEQCAGTPTPGPTATGAPQPTGTQAARTGKASASRLFLIDNSGSMDGARIQAAISSAQSTLGGLSPETEVAVQFFGTSGCNVAVVQDFTLDHAAASQVIASATAWGDTPLAAAISQGGSYMRANASSRDMVMILLSDGEETCQGDPVGAAGALNGSSALPDSLGAVFQLLTRPAGYFQGSGTITLHVVGFGIPPGSPAEAQLQEVAAAGLGNYYQADDEIQLTEALQQAVEDSPETRPLIPRWLWICGGSLLCLVGLGLGIWAVAWLTRRSRRQAGEPQAPVPSAGAPESLEAESDQPPDVIAHIKKHNGLPILAHPFARPYPLRKDWVKDLLGAELWNTGNDGGFTPHPHTLRGFEKLRAWNPGIRSYTGIDLHRFKTHYDIRTFIEVQKLDRDEILEALRTQSLDHRAPMIRLTDSDPTPSLRLAIIRLMSWGIYFAREFKHRVVDRIIE